jgi:hypothetical protein
LELRLASFYQSTLIGLQEQLLKFQTSAVITADQAAGQQHKLNIARHRLVTTFRTFVNTICLAPLLGHQTADTPDPHQALEEFLMMCSGALSEKTFIGDYNARFSVRDDFGLFEQAGLSVDPTRKHYILDALNVEEQARAGQAEVKNEEDKSLNGHLDQFGAAALPEPAAVK